MLSKLRRLDPIPGDWRVKAILTNEAFERFAYYSSRAVLALYMNERLGYDEPTVVSLFAYYVAGCYLSPLLGGLIGDVYWGKFRTIVVFNVIYMSGLLTIGLTAFTDSRLGCLIGLGLMALGTGGIKPHAGPFGAEQRPAGSAHDSEADRSFWLAWYFCINLGSLLSYLVAPAVRAAAGYGWAYLTSFFALVLSLAIFLAPARSYVYTPPSRVSVYATIWKVLKAAACGGGRGGQATSGGDGGAVVSVGDRGDSRTESTPLIGKAAGTATEALTASALQLPALSLGASALLQPADGRSQSERGSPSALDGPSAPEVDGMASPPFSASMTHSGGSTSAPAASHLEPQTPSSIVGRKTPASKAVSSLGGFGRRRGRCARLWSGVGCLNLERARGAVPDDELAGVRAFLGLIPLFSCLCVFWLLYDTQDSLWTLQRKHMDLCLGPGGTSGCMSPEFFGVLNPLLVLIGVPLMDRVYLPGLKRLGVNPTPLRRMTFGMQAAAVSFGFTALVQYRIDSSDGGDGSVPVAWQVPQFLTMNTAELCVSATGLEFSYSQAPPSMKGTVMALFFVTTFVGNLVNGAVYPLLAAALSPLALLVLLACTMSAAGVVFGILAWRYVPVDPAQ